MNNGGHVSHVKPFLNQIHKKSQISDINVSLSGICVGSPI
jgi:hypothetical protein